MKLIEKVNDIKSLKKLSIEELNSLSGEIREFLINSVSETGGHLASNLGVVDLTLALHYVFDSPKDHIIWDVSHQIYTHKIITGRRNMMNTLRQKDGLSGYATLSESEHDKFEAGHASTSLSAAYGYAYSSRINGVHSSTVAVIGDGSLTGGMAFEALNIIGQKKENVIIVINDNSMSIDKNVGGLNDALNRLRTHKKYNKFKSNVSTKLRKNAKTRLSALKDSFRHMFLPSTIFEDLGFHYYGPIDGHDIKSMIMYLKRMKNMKGPVVLHALTQKGKGYKLAEEKPDLYHGVSKFDPSKGVVKKPSETFSSYFGSEMIRLASKDKKVVAISAAMPTGTGLSLYSKKYRKRFIDVGIAEENAVTSASAMALNGLKPYVAIYSTFMQRGFDQLIHDTCMQGAPVTFCMDRSGIVGNDGKTHQGIFDTGYLSIIPNMLVLTPKDKNEFSRMMDFSLTYNKPLAIKYPRDTIYDINDDTTDLLTPELISNDSKTLVISYSRTIKTLIEVSKEVNIDILNARIISPIKYEFYDELFKNYEKIFVIEESAYNNSLAMNLKVKYDSIVTFTLPREFIEHGNMDDILDEYGFSKDRISEFIRSNL